ncbi:MAG: FliM/FliN family flagellar motor switch protein [Erythrobacter sp.]
MADIDPVTSDLILDCRPAVDSLLAIDPELAASTNRLHRLIAAEPSLDLVRGCHERGAAKDEQVPAFEVEEGVYWCPLDAPCHDLADLDGQVAYLSAMEESFLAVERALRLRLAPARIVDEWDAHTRWIELRHAAGRFALGLGADRLSLPSSFDKAQDPAAMRVPIAARLSFRAALLPIPDLERLSPGALLRLPAGPAPATLHTALHREVLAASWTARCSTLTPRDPEGASVMAENSGTMSTTSLRVPVTVRLPETAIPAGEIETLAEGGTIALAPIAEGLEAELLVSGQIFAKGEIVRLGEDFAFLVDTMNTRSAQLQFEDNEEPLQPEAQAPAPVPASPDPGAG